MSVLSGSDAAGERVSENWKCQFCPVQILQVKESVIHIPQMRQSVRTGVPSGSDTTSEKVSEN